MNYRKTLLVFVISTTLLLNSCAAPPILLYIILIQVGRQLASSVTGEVIERLFDEFFFKEAPVRVDPNNPLIGYSNESMVFKRTEPPPPAVILLLNMKMIRDSVDSDWKLHPDEREKVDKALSTSY